MILRSTDSRTRPTLRRVRSTTTLRPLHHRLGPAPGVLFRIGGGVRVGRRVCPVVSAGTQRAPRVVEGRG
ncbi:hypothetical protein ACFWIZ_45575, partial [Streptomyces sp. NPDC127044]